MRVLGSRSKLQVNQAPSHHLSFLLNTALMLISHRADCVKAKHFGHRCQSLGFGVGKADG